LKASHSDVYEFTAMPVAAYLNQYLDGTAKEPGLSMMGQLVEPKRFFGDLERMGAKVEMTVRPR